MSRTDTRPLTDKQMWRKLIARAHPDSGGDHDLFIWCREVESSVCALEVRPKYDAPKPPRYETPANDPDRIPFPASTDFREATLSALRYAASHTDGYGQLLQFLEDCLPMRSKHDEQQRGASYRRLAAIGHLVGMNKMQRSRWYAVARSIPLSDRHAGHILMHLKRRSAA